MTATIEQAVARMTRDEAKILAHYAAGETSRQIATNTGLTLDEVGLALDALAGNDRDRAQRLAMQWQARARAVAAAKGVSGPPAPRPVPAPPKPLPEPPKPYEKNIDGIADMLDAAESSGNGKLERAAGKIRDLLATLQADLAEHSRGARLRQEQAELEARLAQIKAELTGRRPAPATAKPAATAVDSKAVRKWAAANGIECNPHGRVPASVVAAYVMRPIDQNPTP